MEATADKEDNVLAAIEGQKAKGEESFRKANVDLASLEKAATLEAIFLTFLLLTLGSWPFKSSFFVQMFS